MKAGDNCFGVISNTGEVYTWGEDGIKIGLGTKRSQPVPFRVPIIAKCIDLGNLFSRNSILLFIITFRKQEFENDKIAFGKDHLIMHTSRSLTKTNHSHYHD